MTSCWARQDASQTRTTKSAIATGPEKEALLPSCIGKAPEGRHGPPTSCQAESKTRNDNDFTKRLLPACTSLCRRSAPSSPQHPAPPHVLGVFGRNCRDCNEQQSARQSCRDDDTLDAAHWHPTRLVRKAGASQGPKQGKKKSGRRRFNGFAQTQETRRGGQRGHVQ